jgi:hypothetical protein
MLQIIIILFLYRFDVFILRINIKKKLFRYIFKRKTLLKIITTIIKKHSRIFEVRVCTTRL